MAMNSGSQELSQFVDSESECASQSEVARSSLIRAPLAKKYGKVLLVVAALVLVALAAGRAARAPQWTAAPDMLVKLAATPGPVADLGKRIQDYSAGKPWPTICSVIYSVICTLPPGNPVTTHEDTTFKAILESYDNLDDTQEAELNNALMTSASAAGYQCPGVNVGKMCGQLRRRL